MRSGRTLLWTHREAMSSAAWRTLQRSRFVAVFLASEKAWVVSGELVAAVLPAGRAHLRALVSDFAMIPAQPTRDLIHRDATNKHLAQRVHLRIRPLSAGIHGQRFVIGLGPPRIEV